MSRASLDVALRQVRLIAAVQAGRGVSDAELLERFVADRDESAFHVLVERHGPAVLGACRRAIGDPHDAEDLCQAVFLVLARKAGSVRRSASLVAWLHRVACSGAANLRRERTRRRRRELGAASPVFRDPASEVSWREVQIALDEELVRLPERYRGPLVLCYLDGRTRDEAARQLGLSPGALRGLLERGRNLLRDRLTRRGLTLSAALTGAALAAGGARAALPPSVAIGATRAALAFASGDHTAPAHVLALAREVLKSMSMTRLKVHAAMVCCAAVLFLAAVGAALTPAQPPTPGPDPAPPAPGQARNNDDTDGDGLPDYQEAYKYRTDPKKKDSAGDGVSDGDRQRRREFAYSVRAVVRVMPPYNLKALDDDYQDVRVLTEKKEYAELEVVVYPLNTNLDAIQGNPTWRRDYAGMKEYLDPGVTTNWDEAMRKELLRELAADGIHPDQLTDKAVVEKVSRWLFNRCKYRSMFCTMYVGFEGGKPAVLPGLESQFDKDKGDKDWSVREQFEHELFGKEMFANRSVGTCTSAAVLQTTVLRALGIPTRMVLCIPVADASDPEQVAMVEKALTHNRVRRDVLIGLGASNAFTSHTFCEAFVGGRWRRLNYGELGQNVLDRNYLGLMLHVHTFRDLSEANLAETWGTRYAKGRRDDVFPHANPYRLLEVSDHFGRLGEVPNPAIGELKQVTISKVYWADGKPAEFKKSDDGWGRLIFHGEEWLEDGDNYLQYKVFMLRADPEFVLKAKGQPDVKARLTGSFYTAPAENLRELEVTIDPREFARMAKGVAYTLHPANGKKGFKWSVSDGVTITRE